MTAEELYKKGNEMRRSGCFGEAINFYNQALFLDPDSPARIAKQMLEEQFAFYHKDYYNP